MEELEDLSDLPKVELRGEITRDPEIVRREVAQVLSWVGLNQDGTPIQRVIPPRPWRRLTEVVQEQRLNEEDEYDFNLSDTRTVKKVGKT